MFKSIVTTSPLFGCLLSLAQDPAVDSLLQLHFEAAGGRLAWKSLTSVSAEDSTFYAPVTKALHERSLGDESYGYKKVYYQPSDKLRFEHYEGETLITTNITNAKEIEYYDHSTKQIVPLSNDFRKHLLFHEPANLIGATSYILQALDRGKIEYRETTKAYGKICHMLFLNFDNSPEIQWDINVYIDTATFLVHATSSVRKEKNHRLYADYRRINGLMIPHRQISYFNGALGVDKKIPKIKINQPLNDSLFEIGVANAE